MDSIRTLYKPPTDHTGSKVVAVTQGIDGKPVWIVVPYQDNESYQDAAIKLANKLGWKGEFVGSAFPEGFVWVCVDSFRTFTVD